MDSGRRVTIAAADWLARFNQSVDLTDVIIRASFRVPEHVGGMPIVTGPSRSRRRMERTQVA